MTVETADTQHVYAFHELRSDARGETAVFQASGATYVQKVEGRGADQAQKVPTLHSGAPYFSPSFVPGEMDLVVHARWSDINFTTFCLYCPICDSANDSSLWRRALCTRSSTSRPLRPLLNLGVDMNQTSSRENGVLVCAPPALRPSYLRDHRGAAIPSICN